MSDIDASGVNPEIQNADGDCAHGEKVRRNVGIYQCIEVVRKESTAIR
jgi:hypothetical protein